MAGKDSFRRGGGKQGFGGGMPPQTNLQPLARMAQMAQQRQIQGNPTAQQFAPQAPVTTMPVNPNMPIQKGPQFRVPPSGGKGGLGGARPPGGYDGSGINWQQGGLRNMPNLRQQTQAAINRLPQQPSQQNSGSNMALAQAMSRFRR